MNPLHPLYQQDLAAVCSRLPDAGALQNTAVMVTGATGMIGACLTDLLVCLNRARRLNLRVIAPCRSADRARARFSYAPEVEILSHDVLSPADGLPRADYIVHAASNAHPTAFSADPVGTMLANITGTLHLLNHLRATNGRRFLFISTGEIYGENPAVTDGFAEDDFGKIESMNPRSCYPESKRAAETLCASYVRQYGADAVVARLCYVYGPTLSPANSRADAQFLRKALAGEDVVLKSAGSQVRSYCQVTDAAAALLTILLRGETGAAYNVANRNSVHSIREYAEALAALANVGVTFDLPPEAERQGYSAVTRAVQKPDRLEALGWSPRLTLREGLSHTLTILKEGQP